MGHSIPAKQSKRHRMRAPPVLFVDLWFICLRQPIMKQQAWFPLQSSEAATVTVPKYIRNVRGILWHFAFPTLPGGQRFPFRVTCWLEVHAGRVWLCSVFWVHHLLSHSYCRPGSRQYQIGSSSGENYEEIKKDHSCEMNQASGPWLVLLMWTPWLSFLTLAAGLRARTALGWLQINSDLALELGTRCPQERLILLP